VATLLQYLRDTTGPLFVASGAFLAAFYFGNFPQISFLLFAILLVLALWDWRAQRLPNIFTALLFLAGLLNLYLGPRYNLDVHLIGAAVGLLLLPALNYGYKKVRGRDGIGMGDAKLLAGIGLWLGWPALPLVLLIASIGGLVYALFTSMTKKGIDLGLRLPFGSFLCFAAWICWSFL